MNEKVGCILRPFRDNEVLIYHQWMLDPKIRGAYVRGETQTVKQLSEDFSSTGWQSSDFRRWMVCSSDGSLMGVAQAWRYDLYETHMEVGRVILPAFRGRGIGTQLMRNLFDMVFMDPAVFRTQAITPCLNLATVKSWEKAGMKVEGTLRSFMTIDRQQLDCFIASLTRADWEGSRAPTAGYPDRK